MTSTDTYRAALRDLPAADWESYLLAHANLPGPRGNLELAAAAADLGDEAQFRRWASLGPDVAPENTPGCFLAFCGVVGLGAVMARRGGFSSIDAPNPVNEQIPTDAEPSVMQENPPLPTLRPLASDPRWRIREGVAMALQRWGDADMPGLLAALADWATGNPWEQRAAAAALCEPRLLRDPAHAAATLRILDEITQSINQTGDTSGNENGAVRVHPRSSASRFRGSDRSNDAFKTLRQGLGYCWSVAVAALPDVGKPLMEVWLASADPDIRWIMRENLKKNRLAKMDAAWVARCVAA